MAKKGNIVKKSKSTLNLLLIAILAVGWICAAVALTSNEDEEAQERLVAQAKVLIEDKLYIRGVNNYIEAIKNYQTDKNPQLELELLAIYKEAEMMEEYYEFVESRIEKKSAEENEYLELARWYIAEENISRAISTLKAGLELFQNDEMVQLKEQIIYANKVRGIDWSEAKQLGDNGFVPTFDGEKWGYVRSDGRVALDFIYDEAGAFCSGYAVVKLNGVYTLIDESGYWNAVDKIGLDRVTDLSATAIVGVKDGQYKVYSRTFNEMLEESFDAIYLNDNGVYVVQKEDKWAILDKNLEPVTDYIYTDVAVNSKGKVFEGNYGIVKDEGGYFLVMPNGKACYEERFANAKGFEGGLYAVADANGKWGFANERAEMVVEYQYTDAYSFSSNLAAVRYGGKWGYINRYNTMAIEPEYEIAYPFINDMALVKDDMGIYNVITLKYYESF